MKSATLTIESWTLRLVPREAGGYWVRRRPSGRTLGVVYPDRSRWAWETWAGAYRGDGRDGCQTDGCPSDPVPTALLIGGRASTRTIACRRLLWFLDEHQAPALGYGPHPQVMSREVSNV